MLLVIVSFISGIIGGMGIGGGTLLIPALTIFMHVQQQLAQSVNLLSFIPTAIVALISHIRQGNLERGLTFKLIAGGIAGALIGSYFATIITPGTLRRAFGVFLFIMGIYEICCKSKKKEAR
jgi:uncharacterized membrane protein YfcA